MVGLRLGVRGLWAATKHNRDKNKQIWNWRLLGMRGFDCTENAIDPKRQIPGSFSCLHAGDRLSSFSARIWFWPPPAVFCDQWWHSWQKVGRGQSRPGSLDPPPPGVSLSFGLRQLRPWTQRRAPPPGGESRPCLLLRERAERAAPWT